ncbi:MAG: hypothetical protein A2X12_05435 [Bacteroidetes bacterium GWE2_29_8]|nr:MAG: hypothetical protein A2X12_05435 [Bacteroidetes bacterium GWE2_29_8]
MTNNWFSVIIPTYNRADFIKTSVESVLNQKYQNLELIIIDDGSNDDTKLIVESYSNPKIKYFYQSNQGRCFARNKGIEMASYDWVCMLDSDDIFLDNHLDVLNNLIETNLNFNVFATDQTIEGEKRKYFTKEYSNPSYIITFKDFMFTNPLALNQICFNKKNVSTRFYSKEDIPISEDWLFFRELTLKYSIFKSNIITNDVSIHPLRSVNIIDTEKFVYYNNYSTLIFINNNDIANDIANKILANNYLMCANILLSNKLKKKGIEYFNKSLKYKNTYFNSLFYKAIFKIILLK